MVHCGLQRLKFKPFRLWLRDFCALLSLRSRYFRLIYGHIGCLRFLFVAPEVAPTFRNGKMNELRGFLVLS